jgi:hypothetical protein
MNLSQLLHSSVIHKFVEGVHGGTAQLNVAEKAIGSIAKAVGYHRGEQLAAQAQAVTGRALAAVDQGAANVAVAGVVVDVVNPGALAEIVIPISSSLLKRSEAVLEKIAAFSIPAEFQTIVNHNHSLISTINAALHDVSKVTETVSGLSLVPAVGGYASVLRKLNEALKTVESHLDLLEPKPEPPAPETSPSDPVG